MNKTDTLKILVKDSILLLFLITFLFTSSCQKEEQVIMDSDSVSVNQLKSGTVSAAEIDELITKIEGYVTDGDLEPGIANSLILKLNNAKKSLEKGNERAAANQLRAVQNQLEDLVSEGTIDTTIGEDIISDVKEIQGEWTCGEPFVDERDGHVYQTVKIGDQCWMAENLAFLPEVNQPTQVTDIVPHYYVYGYYGTDVTEAKQHENYSTYGVLYNWPAVMAGSAGSSTNPSGVQGICPSGWHLPSDAEWEQLAQYISEQMGPYEISGIMWLGVGGHLKATSGWYYESGGYYYEGNGTDDFGFSALPGGYVSGRDAGGFYSVGTNGHFWSSTENDSSTAWYRYLSFQSDGLLRYYNFRKAGASVRCIRD